MAEISFGNGNDWIREVWIQEQIKKIPAGYKILDAGAGQLRYKKYCNHLKYVSQDFPGYDGKGDGKGLQIGDWDISNVDILCDIKNIPVADASFDAVLCIEVFEHLPDPISVLKELSRILRPGGILILTAPFTSVTHYSPLHFYSGFNKYFFDKYLKEFGFKDVNMICQGNFFAIVAQEIRRLGLVAQRYCNSALSVEDKKDLDGTIKILEQLSNKDKGSNELLCFGYRMVAIKG